MAYIRGRLKAKDYGDTGGPWGVIFSYSFYGYSLVDTYLEDKSNEKYRKYVSLELEWIYDFIKKDGKSNFINQGTKIENGIIYQGIKNHILASLVIVGNEKYKAELFANSDFLAKSLKNSETFNAESYKGIAWFVDNVHVYYSLFLTDKIRIKDGLKPLYQELNKNWIAFMKTKVDKAGITLAEVYKPYPNDNQARGCSETWLLVYMYEIDKNFFDLVYPLFLSKFYSNISGFGLINDTPDQEPLVNMFSGGPSIFGYSSSGTALALPLFKLIKDYDRYRSILSTLSFLLGYDKKKGSYYL